MAWDIVLGVVLVGLCAWAMNKVYENVHEKITVNKHLAAMRLDILAIKKEIETMQTDISFIKQRHNLFAKSVEFLLKSDKISKETVREHEVKLEKYGKVIQIIENATKKRKS